MKRKIIRFICKYTGYMLQGVGTSAFLLFSTADTLTAPLLPLLGLLAGAMATVALGIYLEKVLFRYWRHYCKKNRRARKEKVYRPEIRDAA